MSIGILPDGVSTKVPAGKHAASSRETPLKMLGSSFPSRTDS